MNKMIMRAMAVEAAGNSGDTHLGATMELREEPPTPVLSDYLEMIYLTVLFIIGAPLNLAAYSQLAEVFRSPES